MSDGMAGAQLLSWQLATYRMLDAMTARREANAANAEIAHAWAINDEVVRRYNAVVEAHNTLLKATRAYEADCNRRFTTLEQRIAELEQENAALREAKQMAEAKVVAYAKARTRRILSGLE